MTESTWTLTVHKDAASFPIGGQRERVVLLIDCSRSMLQTDYPPSRLAAAKQGAMEFVNKKVGLDPGDEVAVAYFGNIARAAAALRRVGGNEEYFQNRIDRLRVSYWGTSIGRGLQKAADLLRAGPPGKGKKAEDAKELFVPRIVVLSDGEDLSGPDPVGLASRLKKSGVVIDAIGIGERGPGPGPGRGLNEALLTAIASPGRYRYIRDSVDLVKHFGALAEKQQLEELLVEQPASSDPTTPSDDDRWHSAGRLRATRRSPRMVIAGWLFKRRNAVTLADASPYLGLQCPNEQDDETRFRVGDQAVICPVCGRAHHLDCWEWNDDRCYGGIAPCPGAGPRLGGSLSPRRSSGSTPPGRLGSVAGMDRTAAPVAGLGVALLLGVYLVAPVLDTGVAWAYVLAATAVGGAVGWAVRAVSGGANGRRGLVTVSIAVAAGAVAAARAAQEPFPGDLADDARTLGAIGVPALAGALAAVRLRMPPGRFRLRRRAGRAGEGGRVRVLGDGAGERGTLAEPSSTPTAAPTPARQAVARAREAPRIMLGVRQDGPTRCPYCGDEVPEPGSSVPLALQRYRCPDCGCVQHLGCRDRNQGCVGWAHPALERGGGLAGG